MDPLPAAEPPPPPKPKAKGVFGWIAFLGVMVLKFGALALQSLKTSLSMILMIWAYSWLFGWRFAVGFVVLLFVHEMGHFLAAKRLGIPVGAPIFIPFMGAYITMKENPRDAWTEAWMAYCGPLAGGIGCWVCWGLALAFDQPWLMAVASASFVMNLFNLIPVPPLDGGNVLAGIVPEPVARAIDQIRPYGFLVIYALMFSGVLGRLVWPVQDLILEWLQ